jgi:methylated-DNA-[protein]-cysteine S-methyltransferase
LGWSNLKAVDQYLIHAVFADSPFENQRPNRVLSRTMLELDRYFNKDLSEFSTQVALIGTPFQKKVWQAVRSISYGQTISYALLAKKMGLTSEHAHAVGNAVGQNPVLLFVPCHRIVGSANELTGYAGGLKRKQYLLGLEKGQLQLPF